MRAVDRGGDGDGGLFSRLGSPRASIVIVNTNELHQLRRCLPSVVGQSYQDYEVLIVDNASTDGSVEWVERRFPQIHVVKNYANVGYTGANNIGFAHARGAHLVVLNPDTEVEPEWLEELLAPLEHDPSIGLTTSKVMLMGDGDTINACGNIVGCTGMTFCRGAGQPSQKFNESGEVAAVSGAAFAIRRDVLEEIGGFEEGFFIYLEDTDLSWRARLAGYRCFFVATSIAYHDYAMRFSPDKYFREECNRHSMLLKNLKLQSLLVLCPVFLLGEMLAWGYATFRGMQYVRAKLANYRWTMANWSKIWASRARVESLRRVADRNIVSEHSHTLPFEQLVDGHSASILKIVFTPLLFVASRLGLLLLRW